MRRLKIHADKAFLPHGTPHVIMLYPFWGEIPEASGDKDEGRFHDYARQGGDIFDLATSPAEADVTVLPFEWRPGSAPHAERAHALAAESKRWGKPMVVFFNNDSSEPVPLENALVFRTSFCRSTRQAHEFAVPGWSVDFLSRYLGGVLTVRERNPIPTVGYCGYADYLPGRPLSVLLHLARRLAGRKIKIGARLRGRALRALLSDSRIRTDVVYRTGFGGSGGAAIRDAYVASMTGADYALVTRGEGNFSYRMYEVLSCGRIPVFVDTDCVLPYDRLIDWQRYCVWVTEEEIPLIGEKILEFHGRLTPARFRELQGDIRRLYEEWISPLGFFRNLWRCVPGTDRGEAS